MRHTRAFGAGVAIIAASFALQGCLSTNTRRTIDAAERAPEVAARAKEAAPPQEEQASTAPPDDAALAKEVELAALEAAAIARHPSLVAKAHRVRALAAEARAEGSLPAPELMAQIWQIPLAEPYRVDKAGMVMLSVRQHIPAPGTLDLAAEATAFEARRAAAEVAAEARALLREVDRAFADYLEATLRYDVHVAHCALLDQMVAAARARYSAGGTLGDVTRADLERSRSDAETVRAEGMIEEAKARLNGLLARPIDAPLGPPRVGPPATVDKPASQIAARAVEKNPELAAADSAVKAAKSAAAAADRADSVPSFDVGLSYFHPVGGMPAGWGATVGMSMPWLWGAADSRTESAEQRALAERASANAARLGVTSEVARALAAVRAAAANLSILHDRTMPAARRALDAARAGYAAGGTDILAWLDAERASLEVELSLTAARGDLERALADLDRAAGERVARSPLHASQEPRHEP